MAKKPSYGELEQRIEELEHKVAECEKIEKALGEAENIRQLLNFAPFGVFLMDLSGNVIAANRRGAERFGESVEGIIGKHLKSYVPPDIAEKRAQKGFEAMQSLEPVSFTDQIDGRWYYNTIFPILNDKGKITHLGVYGSDVTESRQAEEALRNSEEKYRNILDNIQEGYYEVDIEGNLTFFNDSLTRITGLSRDQLMGMNNREYTSPETARKMYQIFNHVYRTGDPSKVSDYEIIRKDGGVIILEMSTSLMKDREGQAVGFRGILRDMTEEKKTQAELVRTRNFLQNIFDSSIDGIATTDLRGIVTYTTPKVKDLIGYEQEDVIGKKAHAFYGNGMEDAKTIMKGLEVGCELKNHEMEFVRKDGGSMDVSMSVSYLTDEKGAIIGTLGIYKDITERKRLEAQARHSQKLEAMGTLAGGVAHDFNNLLMGIQGRTSLMLMDSDTSHPHFEHLKGIESYVRNAADLTRQLLGFARGGKYTVKATDLNELVERSSSMFGRAKKEIEIHTKYQKDIWAAEVDPGQIEHVLLNLYVNAWQAMPAGGRLYLHTENVVLGKNYVEPYQVKSGSYVKISVTDTGMGMDDATRQRVFDPFFTTKEMGRGTGLGLASAYGIVKNHDGIINVYSEVGSGTTFNIYLPASKKEIEVYKEPPGEELKGTETILLVDDEPMIIDVGKQLMENLGYRVLVATGGNEALEVYKKNRDRVALVVLDMVMPGMSGEEIYEELKEINPEIRVLLASGYSINGKATEILDRGCDGFIQKPFNSIELSKKLREILDKT